MAGDEDAFTAKIKEKWRHHRAHRPRDAERRRDIMDSGKYIKCKPAARTFLKDAAPRQFLDHFLGQIRG
jgi:hypothetical protein